MRLLLAGDVMLGRLVNDALKRRAAAYPWGDTLPLFRRADLAVCNLECVLANGGSPWEPLRKAFHFRSDARNVACLEAAGIRMVSLANNHVMDYGEEALLEMLEVLDRAGIARSGAGRDAAESARPAYRRAGGLTVGLLAFTDDMRVWEAGERRPGIRHVPVEARDPSARAFLDEVTAAKAACDLLVVSAHWGTNWGERPEPGHEPFARAIVEAGADVVLGHSCHVVRGIGLHGGRPVLYSAGDFVDDYRVDPVERNDRSFLFEVEAEASGPTLLRLHPTVIRDFQARRAREDDRTASAKRMAELCGDLGTDARWSEEEGCLVVALAGAGRRDRPE